MQRTTDRALGAEGAAVTGGVGGEIARQLPYVRRYARAVTGTQHAGDESVRRALEVLLSDRDGLDPQHVRRDLFRALLKVWREADVWEPSREARGIMANSSILAIRIGELGTMRRQLLLLTTLEGMSVAEAADILAVDPAQVDEVLTYAKRELFEQRPTDVLVIEDEPVIAMDIASTIGGLGHHVIGIARTREEAVRIAASAEPGLILADIHLADDSTGIDAVHDILEHTRVPVIFITAFPELLLTGDRPEPTYLLTKPFDPDTLAVSIAQALSTAGAAAGH